MWIGGLIIGTILSLLFGVVVNKQIKQKNRLKLLELQTELLDKNKEVASYTLGFIQKNQIIDDLHAQIVSIKEKSDLETKQSLNKLSKLITTTFKSDQDWETFRVTFDQMHDGFFTALRDSFPDLGNADLKLCALLRLNMSVKESAKILGISSDSVKTARYRLRRKFNLKKRDNLVAFLVKYEQDYITTSSYSVAS